MKNVIADFYQLLRVKGKYSLKHKDLIRKGVLVVDDHVEKINNNYELGGKYYEIDQEATEDWEKKFAEKQEITAKKRELAKVKTSKILGEALSGAIEHSAKNLQVQAPPSPPDGEPQKSKRRIALEKQAEELGIRFPAIISDDKLEDKILAKAEELEKIKDQEEAEKKDQDQGDDQKGKPTETGENKNDKKTN